MFSGNKNITVITIRCLAVALLLSGGTLLWVQQSQAFSSPQENTADTGEILPEGGSVRARILSSNPEAESYLSFNPFTMNEIQSTVASPDPTVSGEDESLFSGPSILWIKRQPVRVPVRPPLLSPYIPLP